LPAGGPGGSLHSRDRADEFSLFGDINLTYNHFLRAGGGSGIPDKAVKEAFGSGDEALFVLINILRFHYSRTRRVGDEKV
jgi:hypothetical protein